MLQNVQQTLLSVTIRQKMEFRDTGNVFPLLSDVLIKCKFRCLK